MTEEIKLTQYSRGAGCGCKIAPAVLQEILKTDRSDAHTAHLLVGNSSADDAAVYDMGDGKLLIATTDFFMPVVDNAYDFGRIAAANAISDVYAMGGTPILALAVLGWPVDKLPAEVARQVLEGARATCANAGIPLAGGHSIDSTEPIFGLTVNGSCNIAELKKNNTATAGALLLLTKPLGTGVLSTAMKRGVSSEQHMQELVSQMAMLNKIGAMLGKITGVTAMTDITGFGLAGHLAEMAEGSGLSAELYYSKLPVMNGVRAYLAQRVVPDATYRNWNSYGSKISFGDGVDVMEAFSLLPDPQTNGGLLIAVKEGALAEVTALLSDNGYGAFCEPIGRMKIAGEKLIEVMK